jgi:hypothetical protein
MIGGQKRVKEQIQSVREENGAEGEKLGEVG